jgi:polysaccharide transporter, PST family
MNRKIIKGAFIVTIASLFVKILSIVYKIPYQNITGDIGFYIHQQVYPLFALLTSYASYALPLVISQNINKHQGMYSYQDDLRKYLKWSILIGLVFSILNKQIAYFLNDQNLGPFMIVLSIVLIISPILGILRGVFYANEDTIALVGVSNVIEQTLRVGTIITSLWLYVQHKIINLYTVAIISFSGIIIGMVGSCLYLWFNQQKLKVIPEEHTRETFVFKKSMYLLLTASLLIIYQGIDSFTITTILSKTMKLEDAMRIKGIYDRGLPLIQAALFFVSPIIASYLPHIKDQQSKEYGNLLKIILFLALPATFGLIFIMNDVNYLFYGDQHYTLTLRILMNSIVLYAIILVFTSINNHRKRTISILLVSIIIKLGLNWIFITYNGIVGAAYSTVLSLVFVIVVLYFCIKHTLYLARIDIVKMITANGLMLAYLMITQIVPILDHLIIQILGGMIIYLVACYYLKLTPNVSRL